MHDGFWEVPNDPFEFSQDEKEQIGIAGAIILYVILCLIGYTIYNPEMHGDNRLISRKPVQQHPDERVRQKLVELNSAIYSQKRATGSKSVLIFRNVEGFCLRSMSGKPSVLSDISDFDLMRQILNLDVTKSDNERLEEEQREGLGTGKEVDMAKDIQIQQQPDERVRQKLVELNDAIYSWERATSRESVLIFREEGGFCLRSVSGKPNVPDDISDANLMRNILNLDVLKSDNERLEEEREQLHIQNLREREMVDSFGDGKGPEHRR